ncbi:hypothetical protein J4440_05855 [Candidatus Woesearchaeota archaeon]|nr:hypothetical protein [Candidatus Woesearchaeota archaeon]
MVLSKLEKTLFGIACSLPLVELLFYRISVPLRTPDERAIGVSGEPLIYNENLTPYIGNFPESFWLPLASGMIGDTIAAKGISTQNNFLVKVGKYFPEITTTAVRTYFTLGETLLPNILPGTPDVKDVPAVLFSALAGYVIAKIGRKSGFNNRVYDSIRSLELVAEGTS